MHRPISVRNMTIVLLLVASAMVWAGGSKEQQTCPCGKADGPCNGSTIDRFSYFRSSGSEGSGNRGGNRQ